VALKREAGSGMGKWGKQYRVCGFLWFLSVFGCISVVVEGACIRDCRRRFV
jgi:hypothetical protein